MRQVMKCDYCSRTFELNAVELALKHEAECSFNPANKKCWSCRHNISSGGPYDFWYECDAGLTPSEKLCVEDGDVECERWKSENS